jgi:hypothetical protein
VACPATLRRDVLNSRLSPVNYQLARRFSVVALTAASFYSQFIFAKGQPRSAQTQAQTLEECVERLARRAAALPHERRLALVWTNHAGLSEQRAENLRIIFAAKLEAAQIRVVQGEAAPALRVSIEQTPSQIVITASVPAEGSSSVVMEQITREQAGGVERPASSIRLEKELLWQQETKILSAALSTDAGTKQKKMFVLTEEALLAYREEQGSWKLLATKPLPGPKQPPRAARGQMLVAEETPERVEVLLPGRRCDANFADDSPITCAAVNSEWHAGHLLALPACGTQTWWLRSEGPDWSSEDRVLLRASGSASNGTSVAEMAVPGPVHSVGAGADGASAAVVVRNITTGNYEVYRVALACAN